MRVTVHLHTLLQRQSPQGPVRRLEVTLPPAGTLRDLLEELDITLPEDALLVVVNGRQVETPRPLADGDEVHLIPALSGGRDHRPPVSLDSPGRAEVGFRRFLLMANAQDRGGPGIRHVAVRPQA
jgi:molybdopterin converting factor small subunit